MPVSKASRERIKSSNFGLPRERKFPINTYRRAIAAVAYAKKLVRLGKLTVQERDLILKKAHQKWPSIQIAPTRGFKG